MLGVTLTCLVAWRVLAFVPVPFVTPSFLAHIRNGAPTALALVGLEGSPVERYSVVAMGLNPFLNAFFVFWLARLTAGARKAWAEPRTRWTVLVGLTGLAALVQGESLTRLLFGDHSQDVLSATGLAATASLVGGTMILFALGRIIERYGLPVRNGVWFLFAILSIRKGVHMVGQFIQEHGSSGQLTLHLAAYAVAAVALAAAVTWVMAAVRPIRTGSGRGGGVEERSAVNLSLMIGGFVIPLVAANAVMYVPILAANAVGPPAASWFDQFYRPDGPAILGDALYNLAFAAVIMAMCLFAMRFNFDPEWVVQRLGGRDSAIDTARGGNAESTVMAIATRTSIIGAALVASLVVLPPVIFQLATGLDRGELVVGGTAFVIATALLVDSVVAMARAMRSESPPAG